MAHKFIFNNSRSRQFISRFCGLQGGHLLLQWLSVLNITAVGVFIYLFMIWFLPLPHLWRSKADYFPFLFELWKAAVTVPSPGRGVSHRVLWCRTKSCVFLNLAELFMRAEPSCAGLSLSVRGGREWNLIRDFRPVKTLLHVFLGQESGATGEMQMPRPLLSHVIAPWINIGSAVSCGFRIQLKRRLDHNTQHLSLSCGGTGLYWTDDIISFVFRKALWGRVYIEGYNSVKRKIGALHSQHDLESGTELERRLPLWGSWLGGNRT